MNILNAFFKGLAEKLGILLFLDNQVQGFEAKVRVKLKAKFLLELKVNLNL